MNNKNIVICPTRARPKQFARFLESFKLMSKCSDLLVFIDTDDPYFYLYLSLYRECFANNYAKTTTQLINWGYELKYYYEFFTVTNDDFIFKTDSWDLKLCQKGKVSYGNDLCAREALPTTYVVDGDIARALDWLQMPTLSYMYGDQVWKTLGHELNCLNYRPDVINEHCHWSNLKAEVDETYKKTNSAQTFKADGEAYRLWLHNQKGEDIGKIRAALEMQRVQT